MILQKLIPVFAFGIVFFGLVYAQPSNPTTSQQTNYGLTVTINTAEGVNQTLVLPANQLLFDIIPHNDAQGNFQYITMQLKPNLESTYQEIGMFNKSKDIVVVYPIFTQAAYGKNGFYDYYRKECDSSCLTIPIPDKINGIDSSSIAAGWTFKLLQYPIITDTDIDKNPDILKQYKRVIILHNEYVTKKEFDAITNHPDVVFLYPNALYAQVTTNYTTNTITLVRGHGYPSPDIKNGFGWKDDNSKYEYDVECNDWNFYHKDNYTMMNCYPEYKLLTSATMLELLQKNDPTSLSEDVANWLMYPQDQNGTEKLLDDFNIPGNTIPTWVQNPALWLSNREITEEEFSGIIQYLAQHQIIK